MEDYRRYLLSERGLTPTVAGKYTRLARAFLTEAAQAGAGLSELSAAVVTGYVVRQCRGAPGRLGQAPGHRAAVGAGVLVPRRPHQRAAGLAVPGVAHWGAGSLPRALSPDAVAALAASCDSDTLAGRRDRAILALLARLGLRAGEVAALELDDLDWRAGELIVRTGKAAAASGCRCLSTSGRRWSLTCTAVAHQWRAGRCSCD